MRMRSRLKSLLALGLGAALLVPVPALAETSLTAFDAARQALLSIWAELPLTARNVTLTDGTPSGRAANVAQITDGSVSANGTASHWALIDVTNSRLLAASTLSATQVVTNGNTFTLPAFNAVTFPDTA